MCPPTGYNLSRDFAGRVSRCAQDLLSLLQAELEEWKQRLCKIAGLCAAQADSDIPPAIMLSNWRTMKFAAKGLIVIGWIYILLIIVIMSAGLVKGFQPLS